MIIALPPLVDNRQIRSEPLGIFYSINTQFVLLDVSLAIKSLSFFNRNYMSWVTSLELWAKSSVDTLVVLKSKWIFLIWRI